MDFGIIGNWVFDHIPLWLWIVVIGGGVGALLYFFSPILLPIWRALPTPVKVVLGAVLAGFLAYMGGRYKGRANAEEEERRRNAEALRKRTEVDREIGNLSNKETEDRLRDRWTRDPR